VERTNAILCIVLAFCLVGHVNAAPQAASQQQVKQKLSPNALIAAAHTEAYYYGSPDFASITGTTLTYATNSPQKMIHLGEFYFLCFQNVWVMSTDTLGPLQTTEFIPLEITKIDSSQLGLFNPFGGYMICVAPALELNSHDCCVVPEGWKPKARNEI
jgi:hypothetical protein